MKTKIRCWRSEFSSMKRTHQVTIKKKEQYHSASEIYCFWATPCSLFSPSRSLFESSVHHLPAVPFYVPFSLPLYLFSPSAFPEQRKLHYYYEYSWNPFMHAWHKSQPMEATSLWCTTEPSAVDAASLNVPLGRSDMSVSSGPPSVLAPSAPPDVRAAFVYLFSPNLFIYFFLLYFGTLFGGGGL